MRVLYILNSIGGGASQGIYESLRHLDRNIIEPYCVTPPGTAEQMKRAEALFAGVKYTEVPWFNIPDTDVLRRIAMKVGQYRRGYNKSIIVDVISDMIRKWKIDIVHTGTAMTLDGALAAWRQRIPHIWHIKETIGSTGRVKYALSDNHLVETISKYSATVVAMSKYIADPFIRRSITNLKIIPDGVYLAPFQSARTKNLRKTLGIGDDEKLIGMVASMTSRWKRHDLFIEMARRLTGTNANVRFVIIGPTPTNTCRWPYDLPLKYYKDLLKHAAEFIPENILYFREYVPDPADIMRSLDVLVHPCEIEPFGRIAIEAMAAGTPVVGPATGGISETIIHNETGLLAKPLDADDFALNTTMIINNHSLAERLGNGGLKRASEYYSIHLYNKRMTEIYLDC